MTVIFDMAREIYVSRLAFTSAEAILDFRYYQKPNTPATAEAWLEANFGRKRNSRRTCVSDRMHWLYQLSLSSIFVKWIMFFPLATIVILIILVFSFFYLYVAAVLSPNVSVTVALEAIDLHTNDQNMVLKVKPSVEPKIFSEIDSLVDLLSILHWTVSRSAAATASLLRLKQPPENLMHCTD